MILLLCDEFDARVADSENELVCASRSPFIAPHRTKSRHGVFSQIIGVAEDPCIIPNPIDRDRSVFNRGAGLCAVGDAA